MEDCEPFASSRPRAGQEVTYLGKVAGIVRRVEGNLCWTEYYAHGECLPFIWRFREGLNTMHDWPTKSAADTAEVA